MTTIEDVTGEALLAEMLAGGYVREQWHPTLPLRILNYTEKAVFERVWNAATRACRGLVVDASGTVVARPWRKFFNHGEPGAPVVPPDEPVVATDKLDGCFPGGTALNLWGGGTITIETVVRNRLPVTLVGMDECAKMIPALVTDWHENGRKDHWLDIEVDPPVPPGNGATGHPNTLRVTVNHHIAVGGDYRPACQIKPEDILTTLTWEPDQDATRLIRTSRVLTVTPVAPTERHFPHGRTGYDLTTTTHNYLACGVLVHNSLGILYPTEPGHHAVATRGSFVSDQAQHATAQWERVYAPRFCPPPGVTVLVEIVYPDNRIVLDYGDRDELVLLGGVAIATGATVEVPGWPGPRAARLPFPTFTAALAAPPRPDAEGLVLHVPRLDERIKLKQSDYVTLHRLVFGLTTRRVWERLAVAAARTESPGATAAQVAKALRLDPVDAAAMLDAGPGWWDDVRRVLPEEFAGWLDDTAGALTAQADALVAGGLTRAAELGELPRRDAAAALADDPSRGLVFAALDGKPLVARAWSAIRPEHERPLLQRDEDVG